jgi:hypothetical protein
LTTADIFYLEQLKEKYPILRNVIHKQSYWGLKDKTNELILEKSSMCC